MAFEDLRLELLHYKTTNELGRRSIMENAIQDVAKLPDTILDEEQALHAYQKMAYTATLINYANALSRIENQDFFEILIDFRMPEIFEISPFTPLNDFFEFHPTRSQMRFKKKLKSIPLSIWQLFREAQKIQLKQNGLADKFNLDELDLHHPPADQLYPIPIQMMAKYINESVDRVSSSEESKYSFAKRFDFYFLPGGGMVEIDLKKDRTTLIKKLLDEHLEEEHGNLWRKATQAFNQLEISQVLSIIKECIHKITTIECMLEHTHLNHQLNATLLSHKTSANVLADVIHSLDQLDKPKKFTQRKLLHELRATIQVELFKLTPLYQEAIDFIDQSATIVQIEQLGDTRVCGGKQISNSFLMNNEPLEAWFSNRFNGAKGEFADDLLGSDIEHLTFLELITHFKQVKFSHLLIVLANEQKKMKENAWDFKRIWKNEDYLKAKRVYSTS